MPKALTTFMIMFPIPSRCVDGLSAALSQIYIDQEPSKVLDLTQKVATVFAKGNRFADGVELEELKQLRADAQASRPMFDLRHETILRHYHRW